MQHSCTNIIFILLDYYGFTAQLLRVFTTPGPIACLITGILRGKRSKNP